MVLNLNMESLRRIPKKIILLCVLLLFIPNLLVDFDKYYIDDMAWFILLIPCFILSYYLGFKGSFYTAVMVNVYHLSWYIFERYLMVLDLINQELAFHIGVAIITFLCSFVVGLLSEKLKEKQAELESLNGKLKKLALYDTLTGLPNRFYFKEKLQNKFCDKVPVTLMFIDLDGFKQVNDRYGHDEGDLLLKEVSSKLNLLADETTFVSRIGGDEFTILLTGIDQVQSMNQAKRILNLLQINIHDIKISASIGIAASQNGDTPVTLIKHADTAMYKAKSTGKNNFCLHTDI
jgi:diguanylate cyclase (GGDEF)-like protein